MTRRTAAAGATVVRRSSWPCAAGQRWCAPWRRRAGRRRAEIRRWMIASISARRPLEAGAREAVQERGEIRRFPGLEAASEQGAVGRLQACPDRPVRRLALALPSTPAHAV